MYPVAKYDHELQALEDRLDAGFEYIESREPDDPLRIEAERFFRTLQREYDSLVEWIRRTDCPGGYRFEECKGTAEE